ncbi:MAG: GTP-binding protein [Porticoccaceae bacterium]
MSSSPGPVATNVITGFLGAGKTTAILSLLAARPTGQRWAVLVNEFGEVGIDGSLMTAATGGDAGVVIREVPGGCMCCASGLPMQIALNQLIGRAGPERLLIEPTGLGHPQEVIATLNAGHYRDVIDLRATLTLVDARNIADSRYTGHEVFNQQLAVADLIVASKADLYRAGDLARLTDYLAGAGLGDRPLEAVTQGALSPEWLDRRSRQRSGHSHHHHYPGEGAQNASAWQGPGAHPLPESGYLRIDNAGEGLVSSGWLFEPRFSFSCRRLSTLLQGIDALRLKAVFITDEGVMAFNLADGVLTSMAVDDAFDSRIEVIGDRAESWSHLEAELLACRVDGGWQVPGHR